MGGEARASHAGPVPRPHPSHTGCQGRRPRRLRAPAAIIQPAAPPAPRAPGPALHPLQGAALPVPLPSRKRSQTPADRHLHLCSVPDGRIPSPSTHSHTPAGRTAVVTDTLCSRTIHRLPAAFSLASRPCRRATVGTGRQSRRAAPRGARCSAGARGMWPCSAQKGHRQLCGGAPGAWGDLGSGSG